MGWKPEMFRCLDTWLKKIQQDLDWKNQENPKKKKKERVEMTLDTFENEPKRVPWSMQERYVPASKREKMEDGDDEAIGWEDEFTTYSPADAWKEWAKISPYFKLKKGEEEKHAKIRVMEWVVDPGGIKYKECKDWIDVGFKGSDALFVRWIREKGMNAETCLNNGSYDDLKKQFQEENQPEIEQEENE